MRNLWRVRLVPLVLSLCLVALAVAGPPTAAPTPATLPAAGIAKRPVIEEIVLDNGLRIFVLESTTSPTFAGFYQFGVGGATDPKGRTGIAHLLEHMLFKGTKTVGTLDFEKEQPLLQRLDELWSELHVELDRRDDPFGSADEESIAELQRTIEALAAEHKALVVKNEYDELMTRAGAVSMNASTSEDVTRYFVQLPSNRLELWFRLESDRLLNPVFREFYSERDVVLEERRLRTDNTASGRAYEALQASLFAAHPYGNPVVGWPRDLERLERQDAIDYFTTYYSPSNCVMVLSGDVRKAEVERLARKYFGPWKRQRIPRLPITTEPEQQGARRRIVEFDADPQLSLAWMTVPEGHPDQYALDVLSAILGGMSSSRIDQTIVQQERIAARAGSGHPTSKYAGSFRAFGVMRGEHATAELEAAIEREIARIQQDGVTADEVERARTSVEVGRVRSLKSNLGQAIRVANAVFLSGGVGYIEEYEARINAVSPEQVRDVAVRYLKPERKNAVEVVRVAGVGAAGGARGGVEHGRGGAPGGRGQKHSKGFEAAMDLVRKAAPVTLDVPEIGKDVSRVELPGGMIVFVAEDHTAPSVEMSFGWLGGSNTTPVEELTPYELAGDLITEGGTEKLTPADVERKIDELGLSFSLDLGSTQSDAYFWSLARNFDESFDLALDILTRPRFDAERLETLKGQYVESMRRRQEQANRGVGTLLEHVIYADHPRLGFVPTRAAIEAVTPDQVRQVWKRHLGSDNLRVTVVGDFEAEAMLAHLRDKLGSWRAAEIAKREFITYEPILRPGAFLVEKDLPQPAIRLYHQIPVDRQAPMADHAALEIMNDILGGSGFRSRLMERLRSDEGLTYGISSGLSHHGRPGQPGRVQISYQTKKDSVVKSIDSALEEFRKIVAEQVTEAEVAEQIDAWRNGFIFRYTNAFSSVSRLMWSEFDDRPYDFDQQELAAVQKVSVADVKRAAERYLRAENLTIAVFGTPSDADRAALTERFGLRVLDPAEVFSGGYEKVAQPEPAPAGAAQP